MVKEMDYHTKEELYQKLKGAFKVKLRLMQENQNNIREIDIWNYLKINKWSKDKNLTISEMVNDIINVDYTKVYQFVNNNR